jgi:hypothetical protein
MLKITFFDYGTYAEGTEDQEERALTVEGLHSIRCTPFELGLVFPTGPHTLLIDQEDGRITWDGQSYRDWTIQHADPTGTLLLRCGSDSRPPEWGPLTCVRMAADHFSANVVEDDPIDGHWCRWWLTEDGRLRLDGTVYDEWRIVAWSNILTWDQWQQRFAPIIMPAPTPYGLVSDAWCIGPSAEPLFAGIPTGRCWKLIHQDGHFCIVQRSVPGTALGWFVTQFPNNFPQICAML